MENDYINYKYDNFMNNLEEVVCYLYNELYKKYMFELKINNGIQPRDIISNIIVNDIGYPIPNEYLKNIHQKVKQILMDKYENNIDVDISEIEYLGEFGNNVIKCVNGYQITLTKKLK